MTEPNFNAMKADPMETSAWLPAQPKLSHIGNVLVPGDLYRSLDIVQDEHGRKFCKLAYPDDKFPQAYGKRKPGIQALATMALKGAVNMADVLAVSVEEGKRPAYYSLMVEPDDIQKKTTEKDVLAELFVLAALLGDYSDRDTNEKNIVRTVDTHVFFDFGEANFDHPVYPPAIEDYITLMKLDAEVLRLALKKLHFLENMHEGESGLELWENMFLRLEKAGENMEMYTSRSPEELHTTFMQNIKTLMDLVKKRLLPHGV